MGDCRKEKSAERKIINRALKSMNKIKRIMYTILFLQIFLIVFERNAYLQETASPEVVIEQSQDQKEPEVEEKPPVTVKQIIVENIIIKGCHKFAGSELKNIMATKEKQIYEINILLKDIQNILIKYRDAGYIYVEAKKTGELITEDENNLYTTIEINIDEGKKYLLNRIDLKGMFNYPENFIRSMFDSKEGRIFDRTVFENDMREILSAYQSDGFPDAKLKPDVSVNEASSTVNISMMIDEGKRGQIGIIDVNGNKRTKKNAIIREMRIKEGEYFTDEKLEDIKRRLMRMEVINYKDMKLYDTDIEGQIRMVVEVEEKPASSFSGYLAYNPASETNSEEKAFLTGYVDINLKNILGTARKLHVRWEQQDRDRQKWDVGYIEPWLFGQPIEADFNVTQTLDIQEATVGNLLYAYTYNELNWGFAFNTLFSKYFSGKFGFGETTNNVIPDGVDEIPGLKDSISFNFTFGGKLDTVDIPWNPTKGFDHDMDVTFRLKKSTGINNNIYSITEIKGNIRYYFNIKKDIVFATRGNTKMQLIYSSEQIPAYDYFKFGGSKDLRGYIENQFNGTRLFVINNELRFLSGEDSYSMVFVDIGGCWRKETSPNVLTTFKNIVNGIFGGEKIGALTYGGIGYGIGFSIKSTLGMAHISIAMGHRDSLSNIMRAAKIHASFETNF